MAESGHRIEAVPLTAAGWDRYGWVPVADTDERDGIHRLTFEWGDAHLNVISHSLDEIEHEGDAYLCDRLFRHRTHTQALTPLDSESVIAVAPADAAPTERDIAAFLISPRQTAVLHQGTWHWGPFPVGAASVSLLNLQGLRYVDDNDSTDLAATGSTVEIIIPV